MNATQRKWLVVIAGPTAVGKTALSIHVAEALRAEIISADSRQFYREMNIGTSKPTPEQLARVPHHFVNHLSIHDQHYSAGKYEQDVLHFLQPYYQNYDIAVMTGGSGLFIRAVCHGFDTIDKSDAQQRETVRRVLNEKPLSWLQEELERLDPAYYEIVDTKNPVRLKRALEVIYTTGRKYSELRTGAKKQRPFEVLKIGLNLPREELYARIDQRTEQMIRDGLPDEASRLYPYRKLPALQTVGYPEMFDYLENKTTLADATARIKQSTRQYAKRQITWFKKEEDMHWFHPAQAQEIIAYIQQKISG
ncbi:MAG: tRNA (adenosine(37)-N6)-dimethylallyltransferase MiaA [Chitinophagales bacterium]|nr:tRNA (adenosine(37)-N6)-dimethylallyltransferase MiaA [Chitinophagales bacterium]MDW8418004.1 tRNA (adenosine(37)-N6)-dimethylallyltransferase MiaA [Chitinophagales bacterium]